MTKEQREERAIGLIVSATKDLGWAIAVPKTRRVDYLIVGKPSALAKLEARLNCVDRKGKK